MSQWSAHIFMEIYHVGMCSIWIKWLLISRQPKFLISLIHYLNRIVKPTKLTVIIIYANQVMSPHPQKRENRNESIMLLFIQFSWSTPFLIFYPFLGCTFFCTEIPFWLNIFLHLVQLWVWCLMLSLMLRLMIMLIVHYAWCTTVLACTILVVKLNKIFGIIINTIKILHGLYCTIFKNMFFWCGTKSKLAPGLHGGRKNILPLWSYQGLGQIYISMRKHYKAGAEVLHVFCIPVWIFHQWHILYCNLSTK